MHSLTLGVRVRVLCAWGVPGAQEVGHLPGGAPGAVHASPHSWCLCVWCACGVPGAQDQKKSDIVDISLRPEELEGLDDAALAAK